MKRFKIDLYDGSYRPFSLWVRRTRWWTSNNWTIVERFEERDQAVAFYEKIKDLPEYLD